MSRKISLHSALSVTESVTDGGRPSSPGGCRGGRDLPKSQWFLEGLMLSQKKGWRRDTWRQVAGKNTFAVGCASLGGLCRRLVSGARSRGPSWRAEAPGSGTLPSRWEPHGLRLEDDPWLPRPATAGFAARGALLRG